MALTQEAILSHLITEGGKVKKSELIVRFKGFIDSADPAEKEKNKELFKTFVNNVAFVKEIDGARYVVLKKVYKRLVDGEKEKEVLPETAADPGSDPEEGEDRGGGNETPSEMLSPIEQALKRSKSWDVRVKKVFSVEIQSQAGEPTLSKPHALPLRVPPSTSRVENLKEDSGEVTPQSPILDTFQNKRRSSSLNGPTLDKPFALPLRVAPSATRVGKLKDDLGEVTPESPTSDTFQNKGRTPSSKSTKAPEEPKVTRTPPYTFPLEHTEHEWLVKCAAGLWTQVYGLLLKDHQLAEKKDFMSGFTALHWAAKSGNKEMLVKIMDLSKQGGVELDINAKTYGGYTPLHIAALHHQESTMAMLLAEYGADPSIRDNCGKKAFHYLEGDTSDTLKEMLGELKAQSVQDRTLHEKDKEELDLFPIPDFSKSLHTIRGLFQPHATGHKKKHKRSMLFSLSEDASEEREDSSGFRNRLMSDAFM